ncbi:sensor histidine kinase [Bacillus niameyensis]|uniref:sensor histidine kinase n=1 Tax=Bacillus niameyensis TaxID=1522308 RepID=UPI0007867F88|nr:GHKL domain-containing protein [Bacillus niameyensis]
MEWFLLWIPWILAVGWTLWMKSMIISIIVLLGAIYQLFLIKKDSFPVAWKRITIIVQLCWLAAAIFTGNPVLTIGLIIQGITLPFFNLALRNEKRKIAELSKNYEHQTTLLYELRKQRHDLQKHMAALLHADNSSDQTAQYRNEIQSRFTQIDQVARSESNVVAGALYAHYVEALKRGVKLDYHLQQTLSSTPLSDYELIAFIGNILENAIDAAAAFGQGTVSLISRKQSGIWIISCQNDTLPLGNDIIDRLYTSKSKSTKGDHHEGLGTQEIRRIVKHYKGTLDFSVIDQQFTLKIKIPDVRQDSV